MILNVPIPTIFLIGFRDGDLIVISSKFGTQQKDFMCGTLFTLTHLFVFHLIVATCLTCLFPFLVNDMHIVGCVSYVILAFYDYKWNL
jgi:hypothetical protein